MWYSSCLLGAVLILSGCAGMKSTPKYEYELVNTDQIAIEEIQASPTAFTLNNFAGKQAWERARLFLDKYVTGTKYSVVASGQDSVERLESKADRSLNYKYRVERLKKGEDYQYTINCVPLTAKGTNNAAKLNAKNLSRFLKDGTLEVSQLVY
ncbi:MAG: hypothetical protein R3A13_12770 [Bdellovibrionota bacterium]